MTVYHGNESISFLGPKIWNILPNKIKQQTSLNSFKKSVKKMEATRLSIQTAKFISMVSFSFLSSDKCREILLC